MTSVALLNSNSSGVGPIPPFTPAELRHVRSSLFTARAPVSFGPRPFQPDNCFAWGTFVNGHYTDRDEALIFEAWRTRGYTHAAIGAFVDGGYHGQFPPTTLQDFLWNQDRVLARINRMRAARIVPIAFVGPDNWTLDQMRALEPVFRKPEWQEALPIVIPKGWEPSADTSNAEWVAWHQWGVEVFPKALHGIHMVTNMDAPGNNDDLTPGLPTYIGMAECWHRLAPYLSFFFGQYGPFETTPAEDPDQVVEWEKVAREHRFRTGYAGWPTFSETGPHVPILHILTEYCSYAAWWQNLPETVCQEWGDIALRATAEGVCDGCTT